MSTLWISNGQKEHCTVALFSKGHPKHDMGGWGSKGAKQGTASCPAKGENTTNTPFMGPT